MTELLPDSWRSQEEEAKCCHQRRGQRRGPVTDILIWVECFSSLVSIFATIHPEKTPQFMAYMKTIVKASSGKDGSPMIPASDARRPSLSPWNGEPSISLWEEQNQYPVVDTAPATSTIRRTVPMHQQECPAQAPPNGHTHRPTSSSWQFASSTTVAQATDACLIRANLHTSALIARGTTHCPQAGEEGPHRRRFQGQSHHHAISNSDSPRAKIKDQKTTTTTTTVNSPCMYMCNLRLLA